jgi:hypothetical protein
MFLTAEEIKALTARVQHRAQARMLRTLGITFKIRADGSVLVLRAHVEQLLGGAQTEKRKGGTSEPNWGALNASRT